MLLNSKNIYLRPANSKDCELLWKWANDPQVREASFSSEPIPWAVHRKWFSEKLRNPNSYIFIAIDHNERPIGLVRFDSQDRKKAEISISIAPDQRRLGYGSLILNQGIKKIFHETLIEIVIAYVKVENVASQRIFEKSNFVKLDKIEYQGYLAWYYQKVKGEG